MPKIDTLFAFIAVEPNGDEGLAAYFVPERAVWMPMVGADIIRVNHLRPLAEQIIASVPDDALTRIELRFFGQEGVRLVETFERGKT